MLRVHDENQNTSNRPYTVSNLRVSPQSGSHSYTQLTCKRGGLLPDKVNELCMKHPHIEYADISYNDIKTLHDLKILRNLQFLSASHNKLTAFDLDVEWDIEYNAGNKSLLQLNVSFNDLTRLDSLSQHQHLEVLDLSHNELTDIDSLKSLKYLRSLNIEHNKIDDLSALKSLPIARFNGNNNRITSLDSLCAEHIQICNVTNNRINSLDCTQNWHQLTEFNIAGNQIIDFHALQNLTNLPLLRSLNVLRNPIDYNNIQRDDLLEDEILWILPDLETLNGTKIDSQTKVESMFNHQAFQPVLDSIANHFQNPEKDKMDGDSNMFWCRLVEEGFAVCWEAFISKFPYLSTLNIDLQDIKIGNAGLHAVCDCIQQCQDLTDLNLNNALTQHRWSDTKKPWPLEYLCDSLLVHNTIQTVDLSHCAIDSLNFQAIATMIEQCQYLKALTLSHNNIGQHTLHRVSSHIVTPCPAIKQLTESILKSDSLKRVVLDHNNIDNLGAYALGRCLQDEQCPLEVLNVSYNPFGIGGNGFGEITKAIKVNQRLKTLDISFCFRSTEQATLMENVFHSMKENQCLETLDISGNMLSSNAMEYLALALTENQSVSALWMKEVVLNQDAMEMVIESLSKKSNLVELEIDTQGQSSNIPKVLNALSGHLELSTLRLSHDDSILSASSDGNVHSVLEMDLNSMAQTLSRLVSFELSGSGMNATDMNRILEILYESNKVLRNLDLNKSRLDTRCWETINRVANKYPLNRLSLSGSVLQTKSDSEGFAKCFAGFWQSKSVGESLVHLDLSNMEWNGFDAITQILHIVDTKALNNREVARPFCLDLSGIHFVGKSLFEEHDYVHLLFNALSVVGVTQLSLNEFKVDNTNIQVPITILDVVNEIFHHLARARYSISALSLSGCDLLITEQDMDQDAASFVNTIGSANVQHIALPKIGNEAVVQRLLRNLKNSGIERVELHDEIQMDQVQGMRTTANQIVPEITTKWMDGVESNEVDFTLNQYICSLAYRRCCA